MSVRCDTYSGEPEARRAMRALEADGVPTADIHLLSGRRFHDVRREPVGGFAGPVDPDAPVGKYAGPARIRRQAAGGWVGAPDGQRQGTYGDADLGTDGEFRRILSDSSLPEETIERLLGDLHAGRAVVVSDDAA
jgi:hypothetical protein